MIMIKATATRGWSQTGGRVNRQILTKSLDLSLLIGVREPVIICIIVIVHKLEQGVGLSFQAEGDSSK